MAYPHYNHFVSWPRSVKIDIKRNKEENKASGFFMNAVNQQPPGENIVFFQFHSFSRTESLSENRDHINCVEITY